MSRRKRATTYYKGQFYQGTMDASNAEAILTLRNKYSKVDSLRNAITNMPQEAILSLQKEAEEYEEENGSLGGFVNQYKDIQGVGELRDEQTVGVAFLYYAGSALLGDEVGLGKTVQIAGLCNLLKKEYERAGKDFSFCFLTEKSSAGQIRDKLMQFTGDFVGLLDSGERPLVEKYVKRNLDKRYYSIVGSHSLLNSPQFLTDVAKRPFDLIIVDESKILKNNQNEFYKNAKALFKYIDRKVLLNATPVEIEIREMYNQLDLLDKNYMPTLGDFHHRFTKTKKSFYGFQPDGYKNEDEFTKAIELRYLARTRSDLGAVYKDNTYKTILVPLSKEQRELNNKTTLKQMVTDYPTGVDRRVEFDADTTPKLAVLYKILEEKVDKEGTRQALVYCRFIDAQEKIKEHLEKRGYRVAILNGKIGTRERNRLVTEFNNNEYDVMLTNVVRGIDLSSCDTCVLYTIDPNPQIMVQFEGRMTRDFDIAYKSVFLLVGEGKEKRFVEETLRLRVKASAAFTNTGKSMVLEAILTEDNKEFFEIENKNENST